MVGKYIFAPLLLAGVPAPHPPPPPPSSADSLNWAFLVAGSSSWDNYRHQADLCHAYHLLVSKGFNRDRIITMAYDDIASHPRNPFPGKLFAAPDPTGQGVDVYDGCSIDYKGKDVTVVNFVSLLLGEPVTGGNGRTLDTTADDDLFMFYIDHGAPGFIQFPDGNVLHASELQTTLMSMHDQRRYNRMVFYIEACQSGSMLDGLRFDLDIYGVTAVGSENPSLGTYCGYDSVVNGTRIGPCLGDLFSVYWMKFISNGDGSHTLNEFFHDVHDSVASYASLHYGREFNQQHGNPAMGWLTVADFFHGDSQSVSMPAPLSLPRWQPPTSVFAAPRLAMDGRSHEYADASARPLYHGVHRWNWMQEATDGLQVLLEQQKATQQLHWELVSLAFPYDQDRQHVSWTIAARPANPECELNMHRALVHFCADAVDVSTSYALQFHRVVVNLCTDESLGWHAEPTAGYVAAARACRKVASSQMSWSAWTFSLIRDAWSTSRDAEILIV